MAILSLAIFSNTVNASNSIEATKDRIKEIKIVEEINVEKLIRNKKEKNINSYYNRKTQTTARGNVKREENTQEENETEEQYK